MDEKDFSSPSRIDRWAQWYDSHQPGPRYQALRRVVLAGWLILGTLMFIKYLQPDSRPLQGNGILKSSSYEQETAPLLSSSAKKVPLEAHIMSKCPDARDCLQKLVVPAMEQISDKVDFKLSYIGR
jgi:hypothetical protein